MKKVNVQNMPSGQQGFSLVELMISLVLGLILVGGAVNAFISSRQTYSLQDAMSRTQEAGRFSMELMSRELRHAGLLDGRLPDPPVQGYAEGAALPTEVSDVVISGVDSEVIFIRDHDATPGTAALSFYTAPDPVSGISTLYQGNQPMVEGVEDIDVLYGFDTDGDDIVDSYQPSGTAGLVWEDLVSVQLSVLVAAGQGLIVDQRQTLPADFGGGTAADNRYYSSYSSTVTLRNVRLDRKNADEP